jgi:hypothetical protein
MIRGNVKINSYPNSISVDMVGKIQDINEMVNKFGGRIMVYSIPGDNEEPGYCMSYRLSKYPFDYIIYGIYINREVYETQMQMWNHSNFKDYEPGSKVTCIDNKYFV